MVKFSNSAALTVEKRESFGDEEACGQAMGGLLKEVAADGKAVYRVVLPHKVPPEEMRVKAFTVYSYRHTAYILPFVAGHKYRVGRNS